VREGPFSEEPEKYKRNHVG